MKSTIVIVVVAIIVKAIVIASRKPHDLKHNGYSAARTRGNDGTLQVVQKTISRLVIKINLQE